MLKREVVTAKDRHRALFRPDGIITFLVIFSCFAFSTLATFLTYYLYQKVALPF